MSKQRNNLTYDHQHIHQTAFADSGLLNGFLFSFPIILLVWFMQKNKLASCRFVIAR